MDDPALLKFKSDALCAILKLCGLVNARLREIGVDPAIARRESDAIQKAVTEHLDRVVEYAVMCTPRRNGQRGTPPSSG